MPKYANLAVQTDDSITPIHEGSSYSSVVNRSQPKLPTTLSSIKLITSTNQKILMSRRLKKWLCMLCFTLVFGFFAMLYLGYIKPDYSKLFLENKLESESPKFNSFSTPSLRISNKPLDIRAKSGYIPSFKDVVSKDFQFNIEGHDVMVFLHIQKTGGTTFGKHLVSDLELERECICHRKVKKRCTCLRPGVNSDETWLFSRYSTGWKCGLHADWTELTSCVDDAMDEIDDNSVKRRYFYLTFLRDPISRYLSEFRHVQRGATWRNALLFCNGRSATKEEVPPCYEGPTWRNATLEEFVSCPSNLANNRQTRMLADLTLVDCYKKSKLTQAERNTILLASAKNNLEHMSFFGLTEFQEISQYIFEETFNLKFNVRFDQHNETLSHNVAYGIDEKLMQRILEVNHLDLELYSFAQELLHSRYRKLQKMDPHFDEHFKNMGHNQFSWDTVDRDR